MSDSKRGLNIIERLLGAFAGVRAGEGVTALLMTLNVFLLLTAYYTLKTVREGLIIAGGGLGGLGGDELKIYASAGQAFLLLGVVPAYGILASRVNRIRLLNITGIVFIGCLGVFYVLGGIGLNLGLVFYLWLGIFNVFVIAQFWSYANDIYTEAQGKRLFAIIAVGGSAGAILGPSIAKLGKDFPFTLMLVSAAILAFALVIYNMVNRIQAAVVAQRKESTQEEDIAEKPLSKEGGFQLLLQNRYLLLIAVMILVANLVNTTGEFILANAAKTFAAEQVPDTLFPDLVGEAREDAIDSARGSVITDFYGSFYTIVNLIAFLVQAFLVSRIFKYLGVRIALFFLPFIALGAYVGIGVIGGLSLLWVAKISENSTDYSLQNTVRQALFLPTSREAKYKAKAAIDTFFVRIGDALSAGLVAIGIHLLAFSGRTFAYVNVALAVVWVVISVAIARRHEDISHEEGEEGAPAS